MHHVALYLFVLHACVRLAAKGEDLLYDNAEAPHVAAGGIAMILQRLRTCIQIKTLYKHLKVLSNRKLICMTIFVHPASETIPISKSSHSMKKILIQTGPIDYSPIGV